MKKSDYKQWDHKLVPLPCPFCGKAPHIGPHDPSIEGDAFGFVACLNSRCAVQPECRDGSKQADMRGPGAYKDLAIKRWNRRPK